MNNIAKLKVKTIYSIITLIFLVFLFILPYDSINGAKKGLLLWFNIVLPTLLPFIIVSNIIVSLHLTSFFSTVLYPIFRVIFKISKDGCYPIVIGLLSGYPVGAKCCGDLVKSRRISVDEGQYLLSICNNASPIFIISFIAIGSLKLENYKYYFLFIIIISSVINSFIYRFLHKNWFLNKTNCKLIIQETAPETSSFSQLLDDTILNAFEVMTKIGGYIIIFSIIAEIISKLQITNTSIKLIMIGILEVTTGINHIATTNIELSKKIVLIITLTTFGGISSIAQTKSVVNNTGLSIRTYIIYKIFNAVIACILSILMVSYFNF